MLGNYLNNKFRRDLVGLVRIDDILQRILRQLHRDLRLVLNLGFGNNTVESALQLTDVGFNVGCNILENGVVDLFIIVLRILAQNCHPGLIIRGLDICDQAPFKAGTEPFI